MKFATTAPRARSRADRHKTATVSKTNCPNRLRGASPSARSKYFLRGICFLRFCQIDASSSLPLAFPPSLSFFPFSLDLEVAWSCLAPCASQMAKPTAACRERRQRRLSLSLSLSLPAKQVAWVRFPARPTFSVEKWHFSVTLRPGAHCKHCNCTV
jgi:hypothetical protein